MLRGRLPAFAAVAVVLGSGLGAFAERLPTRSPCLHAIPHWPASTVVGHAGTLVVGSVARAPVLALAGRVHFYEGHDLETVTFAVRVLGRLGVKTLILTNAAGGINPAFTPGALMVDRRPHQPDRHQPAGRTERRSIRVRVSRHDGEVYAPRLRAIADDAARQVGVDLAHGVYVAVARARATRRRPRSGILRDIGADAVGMSTVPEAIVARHMGLEVLGISCITNMAAGVLPSRSITTR